MFDASIVIPVYDEEKSIEPLIEGIRDVLDKNGISGEIIVVDDGSSDGTRHLVEKLAKSYKNVKLVTHRVNLGKSEALSTGFRACEGEIILFMDGDLQYSASDIPRFIQKIHEGFDVVNGWRIERKDTLIRKYLHVHTTTLQMSSWAPYYTTIIAG